MSYIARVQVPDKFRCDTCGAEQAAQVATNWYVVAQAELGYKRTGGVKHYCCPSHIPNYYEAEWVRIADVKRWLSEEAEKTAASAPAAEFLHDEWWGLAEKGWVNYHALAAAYDDPSHARGPIEGCRAKTCKFFVDARRGLIRAYPGPVADEQGGGIGDDPSSAGTSPPGVEGAQLPSFPAEPLRPRSSAQDTEAAYMHGVDVGYVAGVTAAADDTADHRDEDHGRLWLDVDILRHLVNSHGQELDDYAGHDREGLVQKHVALHPSSWASPDAPVARYEEQNCIECDQGDHEDAACSASKRECGHHCNHSWTDDSCCWCGKEWDDANQHDPADHASSDVVAATKGTVETIPADQLQAAIDLMQCQPCREGRCAIHVHEPPPGTWEDAMAGMARVSRKVEHTDRTGWGDGEWLAEARDIYFGEDGSVSAMLNGHVAAMFREIDRLEATPSAAADSETLLSDAREWFRTEDEARAYVKGYRDAEEKR